MIVCFTGGRNFRHFETLEAAADASGFDITHILHGGARGADKLAEIYAKLFLIPYTVYPVTPLEWKTIGKRAGPLRNARMISDAEACIALPGGNGTADCIEQARAKGIPTFVWPCSLDELPY